MFTMKRLHFEILDILSYITQLPKDMSVWQYPISPIQLYSLIITWDILSIHLSKLDKQCIY